MGFQGNVLWCVTMSILVAVTRSLPYLPAASPLRMFALEDLVPLNIEFYPQRFSVEWISETEYIFTEPGEGLKKYNVENDTYVIFLDESVFMNQSQRHLSSFSKDGKYLIFSANLKKVYRYSTIADYSIYNTDNKQVKKIGDGPLQVLLWGSTQSLAYVYENNVYYIADAARPQQVVQLTTEGVPGEIYYGVADWIYEEEILNAAEALWFSPNGTYLAVASFNDTLVESAVYPYYGNPTLDNPYPELVEFKYPKAGRTNPVVGLQVFKLEGFKSEPRKIPAPVDLVGLDYILGKVSWASDSNLVVLWLNRRQNVSVLVNCDLINDKCDLVKEQAEPNGWLDISDPFFAKNGTKMLDVQPMYHGDERYFHVARFDFHTLTTEDLSPGNATVIKVLGWNHETDTAFYLVSPSDVPWQRQVWATSKDGVRCVTCVQPSCHNVVSSFAPGGAYAVFGCASSSTPPKSFLYNTKKDTFKLLNDNGDLENTLKEYKLPTPIFSVLSLGEDVVAHVKLLLPPDMNYGAKYPMVVRVYAGPGSTRVRDMFELEYSTYLAGNRSYVVCYLDVRGSGVMGVQALHAVNNALGTVEVTDTLHAIRRLVKIHPFIDPERVGVWGWSYGGFTTLMMLVNDDRHTLACGAAVAPVTSWLYYDSIYTERYMDTPAANRAGYQHGEVSESSELLRGRKLLLIHGSADDNVHYQNSMILAKKLQHSDIPFEQMSYADENHSLQGVSRHLYHTLDRFWTECFA